MKLKLSVITMLMLGLCSSASAAGGMERICGILADALKSDVYKLEDCRTEENRNGISIHLRYSTDTIVDERQQTLVYDESNVQPQTRNLFCSIFNANPEIYSVESSTYYRERKTVQFNLSRKICTGSEKPAGSLVIDDEMKRQLLLEQCQVASGQMNSEKIRSLGCDFRDDVIYYRYNVNDPKFKDAVYRESRFSAKNEKERRQFCGQINAAQFRDAGFNTIKFVYQYEGIPVRAVVLDLEYCTGK